MYLTSLEIAINNYNWNFHCRERKITKERMIRDIIKKDKIWTRKIWILKLNVNFHHKWWIFDSFYDYKLIWVARHFIFTFLFFFFYNSHVFKNFYLKKFIKFVISCLWTKFNVRLPVCNYLVINELMNLVITIMFKFFVEKISKSSVLLNQVKAWAI